MFLEIVLLIVGLGLLTKGADWLVNGSSDIATMFKVPPIYVGLTIVAFGTSLPELIVSLFAILSGKAGISLGNIIGSNIANIGLIIGLSALVFPLLVKKRTVQYEFPFMIILSFLLVILGNRNYIIQHPEFFYGKFAGIMFLLVFVIFLYYIFKSIQKGDKKDIDLTIKHKNPLWKNIVFIVLGIAGLFWGGQLFVNNASSIATRLGVSEIVIGLTIVSIGTSLPELFTSVVAAMKKHADIAVGNIVGSNIFNIGWVLGLVSVIKNVEVAPQTLYLDGMIMLLFTFVFYLFSAKSKKIHKYQGGILFFMYFAYISFVVIRSIN